MTAGDKGDKGGRLDELNRATFRKHWRAINDKGIDDGERSALPALLADLRANAEQAYGEAPKRKTA